MVDPERLYRPVQYLKGVGPSRAERLARLGVFTVEDLLRHYPVRYYDRRRVTPLAALRPDIPATVQGVVTSLRSFRTPRRRAWILEVTIEDGDGRAVLVWFNQPFREKDFRVGDSVIAAGKTQDGGARVTVDECEILGEGREPLHAAGLVPVYPATEGLSPRQVRALVRAAMEEFAPVVPEILPREILVRRRLPRAVEALRRIHAPDTPEEAEAARRRLAYEELFLLQVEMALRRRAWAGQRAGVVLQTDHLDFRIRRLFPFKLTGAQERAIDRIRKDLASGRPMNRLLQGDVGSGKTVVAAYALLACVGNRAQAALLAPTEILAEQHARTFERLLKRSRVRLGLLSGGLKGRARAQLLRAAEGGDLDLLIGTHALLQEDVRFKNLALTVIDEQQKFGVYQRAAIGAKGSRPHRLVMTATPIPRTLALTLYGDLDLTVLDGVPPGRRPVRTMYVPSGGRREKYEFTRAQLREGRQAYFVYPLVDESDKVALRSALKMYDEVRMIFPDFRVALLHGRMKPEEKDAVMEEFRAGRVQVLVSTIVVEVGIDVPNATVMVIDGCERYGLSQLHQLRGRIGRGPYESYCILFGERNEKIDAFVATDDGFRIAEADLRLRGPGEFLGARQSGFPAFRAARLGEDRALLEESRQDAFSLVQRDPALACAPALKEALGRGARAGELLHVG